MDTNAFQNTGLIGDTVNYYQQTWPDSCAIMSQKFIMDEFGITKPDGQPYTEDELVQYANDKGYYVEGEGTQFNEIGHVMNDFGVPCHLSVDNNIYSLVEQLAQGHKVIVGVDSGELWDNGILSRIGEWFQDLFGGEMPDHALVVAGIDASDPNNIMVIVDDPGSGEHHKAYPLDQFMDAWQDSSCFMCSTDIPSPQMDPSFYETGHIDNVCGVDYSDYCLFTDMSNSFQPYTPDSVYDNLYPAFEQLTKGEELSEVVEDFSFKDYIDSGALQQNLFETNLQSLQMMTQYQPAVMHQAMHGDIGEMMLSHDMANQYQHMAETYEQSGDLANAEFYHTQADIMHLCQVLGCENVYSVLYPEFNYTGI